MGISCGGNVAFPKLISFRRIKTCRNFICLDIRAGDIGSLFNILMTSSGANSMAIGITTFWKAYIYSASPIPFSGHGIFTELPRYN
jgi:hypothetical protein